MRSYTVLAVTCTLLTGPGPSKAATVSVTEPAAGTISRMQTRQFGRFSAAPLADMTPTVHTLASLLGVNLAPLDTADRARWQTADSMHVVRTADASGVLRYRRKLGTGALVEGPFPAMLGVTADSARVALLGQKAPQFRFEQMHATVLAERDRAPRVITHTYHYRQVLDGMAVLDGRGLLALEFVPSGELVSAQIPAVALSRDTAVASATALQQRVIGVAAKDTVVQDGRDELAVATATVVAVAPALVAVTSGGSCHLVPSLCVKVDYRNSQGRAVRREHRFALAQ